MERTRSGPPGLSGHASDDDARPAGARSAARPPASPWLQGLAVGAAGSFLFAAFVPTWFFETFVPEGWPEAVPYVVVGVGLASLGATVASLFHTAVHGEDGSLATIPARLLLDAAEVGEQGELD